MPATTSERSLVFAVLGLIMLVIGGPTLFYMLFGPFSPGALIIPGFLMALGVLLQFLASRK